MDEFNRVKDCRHGRMLFNVNDQYIGRSLDLYGEYSEGEAELFHQLLRPGDVAVDAGANIGAHTLPMAQFVGPTGAVLAFEPQRLTFQTLCANMALNSVTNAFCFPFALGEQSGKVNVPELDPKITQNFGGLALGGEGVPVAVVCIDGYAIERCRLLKVDVEGMELSVLKGASETIRRCNPVMYVENERKEQSRELVRFIEGFGYHCYWHRPFLFNPDNFRRNPENVFQNLASMNMIYLPQGAPPINAEPVKLPDIMRERFRRIAQHRAMNLANSDRLEEAEAIFRAALRTSKRSGIAHRLRPEAKTDLKNLIR